MNWKVFFAGLSSIFLISFPSNIWGCSDEGNPYDYYTSFFLKELPGDTSYQPFHYTNYRFLYSTSEIVPVAEATSSDWIGYCGNSVSKKEAYAFVCNYALRDLTILY